MVALMQNTYVLRYVVHDEGFACRAEGQASFKAFAAQPDVHEQIFKLVAPNIYGHDEIKKAIACLLFGGARKVCYIFALPLWLMT